MYIYLYIFHYCILSDGDGLIVESVNLVGLETGSIGEITKTVTTANSSLKKLRRFVYQKQLRFASELTFSNTFTTSVQTMTSYNATESAFNGVYNNASNYSLKGLMRLLCVHHDFNGTATEAVALIQAKLESWSAGIDDDITQQGFSLRPFGVLRGTQTRAERRTQPNDSDIYDHYRSILISKINPKLKQIPLSDVARFEYDILLTSFNNTKKTRQRGFCAMKRNRHLIACTLTTTVMWLSHVTTRAIHHRLKLVMIILIKKSAITQPPVWDARYPPKIGLP